MPDRYVIDFGSRNLLEAQKFNLVFDRIKTKVLPKRQKKALEEASRNSAARKENPKAKVNRHHKNFLKWWWRLSYRRDVLMQAIERVPRYIACGQVTKRPIFEFISSDIHPNAALVVFPRDDDYSFGILQSSLHWSWFTERCSTLAETYRYTSNSVFDSFPWPQKPMLGNVKAVAKAAQKLRKVRQKLCVEHDLSLRALYRSSEFPGEHPLDVAQDKLDAAVRKAYAVKPSTDPLKFLFDLNIKLANLEAEDKPIQGPGLPKKFQSDKELRSTDCLCMP